MACDFSPVAMTIAFSHVLSKAWSHRHSPQDGPGKHCGKSTKQTQFPIFGNYLHFYANICHCYVAYVCLSIIIMVGTLRFVILSLRPTFCLETFWLQRFPSKKIILAAKVSFEFMNKYFSSSSSSSSKTLSQ